MKGGLKGFYGRPSVKDFQWTKNLLTQRRQTRDKFEDALLEPQWYCWTIILTYKGRMKESQENHKNGEKTITQGIVSITFSIEGQPERRKLENKRERIGKRKWDGHRKASHPFLHSPFALRYALVLETPPSPPLLIIVPTAPILYGLPHSMYQLPK